MAQVDIVMQQLIQRLYQDGEREIASAVLGEWVMAALQKIDPVAYVRFASVYRQFEDIEAFRAEIQRLQEDPHE